MEYYKNLKIPAFLFFEVADTQDLKKLVIKGKPTKNQLKKAWEKIYDAYFERLQDRKMQQALETRKSIGLLKMKIDIVENVLFGMSLSGATKEMLLEIIVSLKKIGIYLDDTKPMLEAILNALQIDLVNLKTELDVEIEKYRNMASGEKGNYVDDVVSIENVLERTIPEEISLDKYISLKKSASKKVSVLKAQQQKTKKR